MKRTFSILLMFSLSTICLAQRNNWQEFSQDMLGSELDLSKKPYSEEELLELSRSRDLIRGKTRNNLKIESGRSYLLDSSYFERYDVDQDYWYGIQKDYYTYDNLRRGVGLNRFLFDEDRQVWGNTSKSETFYFGDSVKEITYYERYSEGAVWILDKKYRMTYDSNGNELSRRVDNFNDGEFWFGDYRELEYDKRGNKISKKFYVYRDGHLKERNFDWADKDTYKYNDQNLLIEEVWYSTIYYVGEQFEPYRKIEFIYDNNYLNTNSPIYEWEGYWKLTSMYEYKYDNYKKLLLAISNLYDAETDEFSAIEQTEYSYDENGNALLKLKRGIDQESKEFFNISKEENSYDSYGFVTEDAIYNWNSHTEKWEGMFYFVYVNNEFGDQVEYYFFNDWDTASDTWIPRTRGYYYYSNPQLITGIKRNYFEVIHYPNPAKETLHIQFQEQGEMTIEIMDLNGRSVLQTHLNNSNSLLVSKLSAGVYLLEATQNGKVWRGKFLKE